MSTQVRTFLIALLAVAVLAPVAHGRARAHVALGAGDRARSAQECADADLEPAPENLARVGAAILCLHNQVRARHGLPAVRENGRLRRAALTHSRDMVAGGYFEHTTPSGVTMVDRIMRARYARRNQGWALGENLAWGTGSLATPRGAIEAWMDSPGHRANILRRSYRELGVGVVLGVPVGDAAGATYTVDFGVRR